MYKKKNSKYEVPIIDIYKQNSSSTKSHTNRYIKNSLNNSINNSYMLDNILHYKQIFIHNRKIDNSIILIKKEEFDIFYSYKRKYPILVKETVNARTGFNDPNEPRIIRSKQVDPFSEDSNIPKEFQHTLDDYEKYMTYGISMGHNAPAGQHKTNLKIFSETFLLSNIVPQEMVFNSGLWALFENWCHLLQRNTKLKNITVFTGSIPDRQNYNYNGISMNVPVKMFKIICFQHIDKPNTTTFMEILIANNIPNYINPKISIYELSSFLVSPKSYNWFQNFSGFNINNLLNYYGFNTKNIKTFRNFVPISIMLTPNLKILMTKSNWYGYLIYANNLEELENRWHECLKLEALFGDLKFHKKFYDLAKERLSNNNTETHTATHTEKYNTTDNKLLLEFSKIKPNIYNKTSINTITNFNKYNKHFTKNTTYKKLSKKVFTKSSKKSSKISKKTKKM